MASTIWISGDTHFGEAKAISLFERPFADVATMDAALLDAINRNVKKRDVLIHIGDFCGPFQEGRDAQVGHAVDIRNKIVCKNIQLIRGNHDPKIAKFERLFDSVKNQATFRREGGRTSCPLPLSTTGLAGTTEWLHAFVWTHAWRPGGNGSQYGCWR